MIMRNNQEGAEAGEAEEEVVTVTPTIKRIRQLKSMGNEIVILCN